MKHITITQLSLVNFKGIAKMQVDFHPKMTNIMGGNGTGKTTIFDAITWLLFGKDSQDRKVFSIRTYDNNGNIIPKLPHEVSGTFIVDGREITLRRCFIEKWVKKRGSSVEEYTGNEEERYVNEVPCNKSEYDAKIAEICPETVFKFITNPLYFVSQKVDVQRQMLFRMAGNINDVDVAKGNKDFEHLLNEITGKTLDEYKREIAAKKKILKQELADIPGRIDENKRNMPQEEDWQALQKAIDELESRLATIEAQANASQDAAMSNGWTETSALYNELQKLSAASAKRRSAIVAEEEAVYQKQYKAYTDANGLCYKNGFDLRRYRQEQITCCTTLEQLKAQREELIKEWREINTRQLTFTENDFVCPTCHRPLEVDDIEAKREEMTAAFNSGKAKALADNVTKGKAVKAKMEETNARIAELEELITKCQQAIDAFGKIEEPQRVDVQKIVDTDDEYCQLMYQQQEIQKKLESLHKADGKTAADGAVKGEILAQIKSLNTRLNNRGIIEQTNERIEQLESRLKEQANELARLEGIEFVIQRFTKARINAIEDRINGLFSFVKFRMFAQQINGGEVETCEPIVNGVPFSSQNKAMTINIGIDIINAICRSEGITAPIVIDNAESINEIIPTDSQLIRLIVTTDNHLRVNS